MTGHHLAQLNVGTLRHPLDDPRTYGFTSMLDILNDVAEQSPGFVWRLVSDGSNDATTVRTSLGADVIVNMSVWESRDCLWDYVYRSGHLDVLRRRAEWFELPKAAFQVMWWIPAGHVPTVEEAVERLRHLRAHGPSPRAFGPRDTYTPTDASLDVVTTDGHDQGPGRGDPGPPLAVQQHTELVVRDPLRSTGGRRSDEVQPHFGGFASSPSSLTMRSSADT